MTELQDLDPVTDFDEIAKKIAEKALNEFIYEGKSLREWINQIPKWIPVRERLPKPGELDGDVDIYYLVQNEYGDMMVARYTHREYWEQIFQTTPIADKIVAWMPLPEEYKVGKEVEE